MTGTPPQKAFFLTESKTRIDCLFNPETLSVQMSNSWSAASSAGKGVAQAKFGGSSSGTMSMKLVFDTTATGTAVTAQTSKLAALMDISVEIPSSDPNAKMGRPEWVVFHWGEMASFRAVVTQLSVTFTYFSSSGTPLRADVDLALTQYEPETEKNANLPRQNPTSGTPYPQRVHRVQPGETLDRLAARYYGDSTRWRGLARANGIGDPLAMRPGSLLAIPLDSDA